MHKLRILNGTGDSLVEWDIDAADAIAEAERIFSDLRARNMSFVTTIDGVRTMITRFEPIYDEIVAIPRIVGG